LHQIYFHSQHLQYEKLSVDMVVYESQ